MITASLTGVRACVFDAYGTVFDYASAAAKCRAELGDAFEKLNSVWREKQLHYTWLRTIQGLHVDFQQVTGEALDYALEVVGMTDTALRSRLMTLYFELDCFPEIPEMLLRLKQIGMKTAILSNGSPKMLDAVVNNAGLGDLFDAVLSVEEVGMFKPHRSVYQLAVDRLGVAADAISFQSSNAWDAYAASAFGMRVVWCNRYRQPHEQLPGAPDREIQSLTELPDLVGAGPAMSPADAR